MYFLYRNSIFFITILFAQRTDSWSVSLEPNENKDFAKRYISLNTSQVVDFQWKNTPVRSMSSISKEETDTLTRNGRSVKRSARSRNLGSSKINPIGCGRRIQRSPHKRSLLVAGGQTVNQTHTWPWMVAIRIKTSKNEFRFLCGGTLITLRHVLTAAHCFGPRGRNRPLSDYVVILGSFKQSDTIHDDSYIDDGITIATPFTLSIHNGFQYPRNEHDIAMISLEIPVVSSPQINPVCLPSGRILRQDHGQVTVIGWGHVIFGGGDSETLQQATFKIIPIRRCRQVFTETQDFREKINYNMICAGDMQGQMDACKGDSGGPLLLEDEDEGNWVQVGIVAFGYRCAEKGFPGLYVRVASYMSWIQRIIEQT